MYLKWTSKALSDLAHLHESLSPLNRAATARTVLSLIMASTAATNCPPIGKKLHEFNPHEVYRIWLGPYEIRYEQQEATTYILRIWYTREPQ